MDYDKLIERLNQYSQSLIAYKLGADFADACMDAASALSTLQDENAQLRADLEYEREHANAYYEECGQWEAENEKLRAELEQVKQCVDGKPAADVAPVRHGRWKNGGNGLYDTCTACGKEIYLAIPMNYCPECGALMEKKEDEHD